MSATARHRSMTKLALAAVACLVVAGCAAATAPLPSASSPDASPTAPVPPASSPTATPPDGASPQAPDPSPAPSSSIVPVVVTPLVLRFTWCQDVCPASPGTTVLADRRVIWRSEADGWMERTLTPEGLAWLRDTAEHTGALGADGRYSAEVVPGAQPQPRGVTAYAFRFVRASFSVRVVTGEPEDYAGEPGMWVIPPEMIALAPLARMLIDPGTSFPEAVWEGPARPFSPPGYLLLIALRPDTGARPELPTDVDAVSWPFSAPIEQVGSQYLRNGEVSPNDRCLPITPDLAARIASAEAAAGRARSLETIPFSLEYGWARGDGFVAIETQWLMPDQAWSCSGSTDW